MKQQEKLKCKVCESEFINPLDVFSIKQTGRCAVCQLAFQAKPENDPDNKKFRVEFTVTERCDEYIYAKDEDAARKEFQENFEGEIDDIYEIGK